MFQIQSAGILQVANATINAEDFQKPRDQRNQVQCTNPHRILIKRQPIADKLGNATPDCRSKAPLSDSLLRQLASAATQESHCPRAQVLNPGLKPTPKNVWDILGCHARGRGSLPSGG